LIVTPRRTPLVSVTTVASRHKASEHLGREAVHYDEHFQADTARDVGQRLVEGTVRDSDASEIREA
jgi:hypothetical protein